ncbi:FAD-dependent oxidoreductase [Cellulosilyticum sp. I15G10I2]|uniref:FAD-dependent oxidoreductase n=1 Tax=Cellulosilyticum sp. I15G10I2 TaxID=1892843 RepID=UPI00085CD343|nr:FAD-dependent oxidoreductase [Cellulosilyticum sp. I15G10I2]
MTYIDKQYDVVVVGGGLAGVCAAIASSRNGVRTALIQDRPVLGGNASSEIRMHICGANMHGTRENARETGIIEEIQLENRKKNPNHSFSILDTILWEKVNFQENLELYLNTRMIDVATNNNEIISVSAHQLTTEKDFLFKAKIFIDCTGDSSLAYKAGANYRVGRESKDEFGEQFAPEQADHYTMGNTVMFKAIDMGGPVPFEKPDWAYTFTEEDLKYRGHSAVNNKLEHYGVDSGYWWIELGGTDNTIDDAEEIRDELLKTVYGIWDHIKNGGEHGAENYTLDWVQFLPGKRESRRIEGDYILKEQDLLQGRVFEDAVAYGGWPMDMHPPEGFKHKGKSTDFIRVPLYTIPYRCFYSKNINNLMMAGRNISASHMAFGSIRIMGTCAVGGQAVGIAAAMAIGYNCMPREIGTHIKELQQKLLKEDCYIVGYKNKDKADKALGAKVIASSETDKGKAINVINGVARMVEENVNCWISDAIGNDGEWIELQLAGQQEIKEVHIKFDSALSTEISTTLSDVVRSNQIQGLPGTLAKHYAIQIIDRDKVIYTHEIKHNYLRHNKHQMPSGVYGDKVKIIIYTTQGVGEARIFEVRVY